MESAAEVREMRTGAVTAARPQCSLPFSALSETLRDTVHPFRSPGLAAHQHHPPTALLRGARARMGQAPFLAAQWAGAPEKARVEDQGEG